MQADLDVYLVTYNAQRPHQGRGMNGRTPADVFACYLPKPRNQRRTKWEKPPRLPPTRSGWCPVNTLSVQLDERLICPLNVTRNEG